ncbi:ANK-REP-REGION domain-containing protein [Mycena chlorophos]|uniref:ANK-REP-REGION domain-containing protein n=1 Tax=Mycena chlorophos TaxID=658473 RepID=A0A8H6TF01_MYCCL|nr:ANK-REP-REGION domain-containing protein [Mycena chlorophos]
MLPIAKTTIISGGTGGDGGQGGQEGGKGGDGQGNTVHFTGNINSVYLSAATLDAYHTIMDFVSPINSHPRQQEVFETWQPGTGTWFLENETFLQWETESPRVLWCTGIPGAGKTVLAYYLFIHSLMFGPD